MQVASRPIVIIADDLSGAAELAGIAYARGYTAEVQRQFDPASKAEVIAVDTDSRGLPPEVAADRVQTAARAILATKPAWIFKKVDSILRGNVRAEIEAMLKETGQRRALLIPANPSRGRTIAQGSYLIGGTPIDQTELANAPEQPRRSALISELLGPGNVALHIASLRVELPRRGIVVPDRLADTQGMHSLTIRCDDMTLPVGAADFFTTLLIQRGAKHARDSRPVEAPAIARPALFVCGSRAAWDRHASRCLAAGVPVRTFAPVFAGERLPAEELPAWADRAARQLASAGRLLLGIGPTESTAEPVDLVDRLAGLAALTLERAPAATLLVEGGANGRRVGAAVGLVAAGGCGQCAGRSGYPPAVWRSSCSTRLDQAGQLCVAGVGLGRCAIIPPERPFIPTIAR